MKWLLFLILAAPIFAQSPQDRAAIEKAVFNLNTPDRMKSLSDDADQRDLRELDRLVGRPSRPWSERTPPRFVIHSIRLVTPEVALVDAENFQSGSAMGRMGVPVIVVLKKVVLKKQGAAWKIVSLRLLPSP